MNKEYLICQKHISSLTYVKSGMELKIHQFRISNPNADLSDLKDKIKRIEDAITFLYIQYDVLETVKKEIDLLKLTNAKLHAELLMIKK